MLTDEEILPERTTLRFELFGAWSGPIFTLLTAVGWLGLAHFIAPAKGGLTAAQYAHWFTHQHRTGVLIGCSIFLLSTCFLGLWTAQYGIMLWRMDRRAPVMSITQILMGVSIVVIIVINSSLWLAAAYRVNASGDTVRALNDTAWMGFLIAWPLLSLQMVSGALVCRHDNRADPLIPRWLCRASIAGAILLFTAGGSAFAQHGAFAFSGVLGFYLPVAIWGAWLDSHAFFMRREIRSRQAANATTPVPPATPSTQTPLTHEDVVISA
jgi:hypothetical protein